ncbi:unnamed protein product [Rotaria sp. Silwood1]|nr:unnamed protein product [Rotaria sp. Silwood1]CAF4821020.1 unnamed protein product [Rotaria sp. Silwood1]
MANWTIKNVAEWLIANGFKRQVKIFKDRKIDGNALIKLKDDDIMQLLSEVNEDGMIQEPTIGIKSRFRTMLIEWKRENEHKNQNNQNENANGSSNVTDLNEVKHREEIVSKKTKKKNSDKVLCEDNYLVDDDIHIQFFRNPKFLPYLINYIKQETYAIDIDIQQVYSEDDKLFLYYVIKLIGKKQQNRIVRNFIKNLFKSIKLKNYHQNQIKKWLFNLTLIDIIQNIFDNENHLFTVCQFSRLNNKILEIYYFDDEKFNSFQNLIEIDNIIQNQILQENILLSTNKYLQTIEFIDINTQKILLKYDVNPTEKYEEEFNKYINQYEQDHMLISITRNPYYINRNKTKDIIKIFGYQKFVNEVFQKFKNLFDKYRLRKYKFSQMSSDQLEYLANFCSEELHNIEREFPNDYIKLHVRQNQFYAPEYLKNEIQNSIINLLSNLQMITFKSKELYYDIADKLCSNIKNIAQQNRCYCELKLKKKLKSYQIPKSNQNTSIISKSFIEQSNLFCSSPFVYCQTKLTNGTIEVLMGDIALQKVDIIIIPSTSFGLKESLIERAGEIIEQQPSSQEENETSSISFITETTSGKLNCKKILFINWSLPTMITNDDHLSDSIRLFISKSIQYVIMDSQQANLKIQSIAFAVPDSCKQEQILAEEMIEETMNQINMTKSISLKVSFVLLPDQQTLHQQFLNVIQTIQTIKDSFGIFYCSASTITITLTSLNTEYLTKCEKQINNYLNRSIFKMTLNGFENWNQYMINAFYKYSKDRYVLPKLDNKQQIILYGPINNVYEVIQKYQLINKLIQDKTNLLSLFTKNTSLNNFNIMLSYSPNDTIISHRLANRLIDEGFTIWINSNQSIEFNQILKEINKSDCIILCISENYFENELCEKEAKYANEIGKSMIPVKVQNYEPIEWLYKLIEKESYFQLFGSENHFNLEYDKLLLKILQCIRYNHVSSFEQTSNRSNELQHNDLIESFEDNNTLLYFLLTPEQKKLKYEKNIKKLIKLEKGKINEDDKKILIEKVQDIMHDKEKQCQTYLSQCRWNWRFTNPSSPDYQRKLNEITQCIWFDIGILSYQQWLNKIENLNTILNIPPFTFTGDINNAIFPMFNEALKNSYLLYSLGQHYSLPNELDYLSDKKNIRSMSRSSTSEKLIILKQQDSTSEKSNNDENDSQTTSDQTRSSIISPSKSKNIINKNRKERNIKKNYDEQKIIVPDEPLIKTSLREDRNLEFKLKFAKQMKKNEYEFQKFCKEYQHSLYLSSKKSIRNYPSVMFGPSPFSNITIEPLKTVQRHNKIELPLKFPWNGVFDTKPSSIAWKDPSIFFFFEATSSQKN